MDQSDQKMNTPSQQIIPNDDLEIYWGHDLDSTRMLFSSGVLSVNTLTPSGPILPFWYGKLQTPKDPLQFDPKPSMDLDSIDIVTKSNVVRDILAYLALRDQLKETFKFFMERHKSNLNSKSSEAQASLDKFWKYYRMLNSLCAEKIKNALEKKPMEPGHYVQLEAWQSEIFNRFFFSHPIGYSLTAAERASLAAELKLTGQRVSDLFRVRTKRLISFLDTKQNRPRWVPKTMMDEDILSLPRVRRDDSL